MTTSGPVDHRISWNEVHVRDLDAAVAFYGALLGWTIREEERETYVHFYLDGEAVAGLMADVRPDGAPPMWQVYVGTTEIEAYVARALAAGQREVTPLMDIPHTGKLQILADPEGALLAPFQPAGAQIGRGASGRPGHFCWVDLLCHDRAAMATHYGEVVGWEVHTMQVGATEYAIFVPPGGGPMDAVAGARALPPGTAAPAAWLPYVAVADVDAAAAQARELGATITVEPADLGHKGRHAVLVDPQGASLGLWTQKAPTCD